MIFCFVLCSLEIAQLLLFVESASILDIFVFLECNEWTLETDGSLFFDGD